jgi:hypothetical protein
MLRSLWLFAFLALSSRAVASPVAVTLFGNLGAPAGSSTLFDNQNYQISFTIPDPHAPTTVFEPIGGVGQTSAAYRVPARLSVPGIGLELMNPVDVIYNSQEPVGNWMNIMTFTGLPVGDFMVVTPVRTLSGVLLWNALAGSLGTPEITLLNAEPAYARFFLEQNTPNIGPVPIAVYENGASAITAMEIPEPATVLLVGAGLLTVWRAPRRPANRC